MERLACLRKAIIMRAEELRVATFEDDDLR